MDDTPAPRDWNALLERWLAPFRTEAAAFRVVLAVIALFGVVIAITLIARALGA
jgi:hypothetical protein